MKSVFKFVVAVVATSSIVSSVAAQQTVRDSSRQGRDTTRLGDITVFGSRAELKESREDIRRQPGGAAFLEPAVLRATRQANLKDVLQFVPGVYVAPRFGAADESQISVRGSGLRDNYHSRGISILVNGMPYRNADGFSDFESLELMTTEAMQVYKGGNAFRFGGATLGGAINLETKTGYTADAVDATAQGGSYGFFKGQASSGAAIGNFDYYASYTRTTLEGYRNWSEQGRDRANLHLGLVLSPKIDVRTFYLFAHVKEELPGSLTAAEFAADPTLANAGNVTQKWGRDYDLHHVGVQLRTQLSATQRLEISPYYQYRDIDHPIFEVINQQSRDLGAEVRYESTAMLGGRVNRFTLGAQPTTESMDNHQYVNNAGQHGALTKDQTDHAGGVAVYAENAFALSQRASLITGLRWERQTRRTEDHFLSNGDQSDTRVFTAVLPRLGVLVDFDGNRNQLFANVTRSFEPPLLLELNSLAVPGYVKLNAQDAWQYEVGTRGRLNAWVWDVSLYDVELNNELLNQNVPPFPGAPFTIPTFRNATKSRHSGIEAGITWNTILNALSHRDGGDAMSLQVSYTYGHYTFITDSLNSGKEIPGAPHHVVHAALRYVHPAGVTITPSMEWVPGSYFVNSANTVSNAGWTTFGLRAEWAIPGANVIAFASGENLGDKKYSGSVQVDDGNSRYFEPANGRSFYAGLRVAH